jgi:hypothetical protein
MTIEGLIRSLIGREPEMVAATSTAESWGPINALLSELGRAAGIGGRLVRSVLSSRSRRGSVELGPGRKEHDAVGTHGGEAEPPDLVVCASGNLALVYLTERPERLTLEELLALHPRLVDALVHHDGIGFVLVRSSTDGAIAMGRAGVHYLDQGRIVGEDPLAPFGPGAADDLRRLDAMPNVGDLVLNSSLDPSTDEVAAFEELVGSHGGLGGWQTEAFVLYPTDWPEPDGPIVGAPALHRQLTAWLEAAGLRSPG